MLAGDNSAFIRARSAIAATAALFLIAIRTSAARPYAPTVFSHLRDCFGFLRHSVGQHTMREPFVITMPLRFNRRLSV